MEIFQRKTVSGHGRPDVLLVSPPQKRIRFNFSGVFPMQPLGVAALAAYLRERGVSASILDAVALSMDSLGCVEAVLRAKPALAAFSTTIFNIAETVEIAAAIKKADPGIPVVLGGHGMAFSAEILAEKLPAVDFFIRGEGEESLFKLASAILGNGDLKDVPGLIYRQMGKTAENPKGPLLDVESLPLPALDLLPGARYSMHPPFNRKPPLCLVESARGCAFSCNFCSLGSRVRQKSVERVLEEIRWAKKIFSAREIHFVDPTFTCVRSRAMELCEAIAREFPGLAWTAKTRVDLIDPELARAMAKSGCYLVSMGVESGSQKMLDEMNKSARVEQISAAASALKGAGIGMLAYIMFGAPGEDEKTVAQTMRMLKRVKPDYALFAPLMPDPLCALVGKEKISRPFTEDDVFKLYYTGSRCGTFFENSSFTGHDPEVLDRWVKEAFVKFYVNPGYVAKRLFSVTMPREFLNLAMGAALLARESLRRGGDY